MNIKNFLKMSNDYLNNETTYKRVNLNCETKVTKGKSSKRFREIQR